MKINNVLFGKVNAPPKPRQKNQQHEAKIQTALFKWADIAACKYPELRLMFHIPNGGRRDAVEAYYLKQQGVKAGIPDIFLPVPRGQFAGLFLELKSERGRLQDSQKTWLSDLTRQGYKATVCYGLCAAQTAIEDYLKG